MKVTRKFTQAGKDVFDAVTWSKRSSRISNPDGTAVFEMNDAEVPASWSQLATDIVVSKYFRKAGVPQRDAQGNLLKDEAGRTITGPEKSVRQVVHRLAGCWRQWGEQHGYFDTADDAQAFYDEIAYMLLTQMCAPNSPQWFNTGLNFAYGITGPAQGHWITDPTTGETKLAGDAYSHPQPHACQPYHALVSTPGGAMPIGQIVERNLIGLEVFDGTREGRGTTRVKAVKANGRKRVYRIRLKNGAQVEATADHLVFAQPRRDEAGDWRRVDQLTPGMMMLWSNEVAVGGESNEQEISEAALAGWLQGDGFVGQYEKGTNRSLTLEFMTVNDDEFAWVMEHVAVVFPGAHYHVRTVESQDETLDIRRIRFYGEPLRSFVEKYELLRGEQDLSVPAAIHRAGRKAQAAYLKSLFQADGTVRMRVRSKDGEDAGAGGVACTRRVRTADVVLTTVSPDLARGVQVLLGGLGVYSRIQPGKDRRANRRPPLHVSVGYAQSRQRFQESIGFVSGEKQAKLAEACSDRFPGKQLPAMREEMVVAIDDVGEQDVFDIQTESGQYLSNHVLVHNCFIQSVDDDLVNPGGIMDLWVREARLFKYGSGTGTNFSRVRGENESLSGGGKSSGLMSWLKIGDRAAGAIKSGGTTRRAAKMVCLDLDHPDIEQFVNWKVREELKVAALVEGLKRLPKAQRETAEKLGLELDYDFNGESYMTVSGQNSNNSVRIPNEFFRRLDSDENWELHNRIDGKVHKSIPAKELWEQIGYAAWRCADPGVQYDTTINEWHTCPASGRINASNPCSEYMFLDNTACNLASLNLMKFYDSKTRQFDLEGFEHGTRLWTIVLEISVLMAAFPSREIARLSYEFRTLGLGYANIGAMLMQAGIPYDSETARAICGAFTAILTGRSYATSAEMSGEMGPFPGYFKNREHMLRVIRNHRRAAYGVPRDADHANKHDLGNYEGLQTAPVPIHADYLEHSEPGIGQLANASDVLRRARVAWDDALVLGQKHGYRNAQTTVIAPTGTIGLLMDCDTTGVEPDFALVKFKKLAGGGYFKIANQSLRPALEALGYSDTQVGDILRYVLGALSLDVPLPGRSQESGVRNQEFGKTQNSELRTQNAPSTFAAALRDKGFTDAELKKITDALSGAMELSFVFNPYTLGQDAIERLGLSGQTDLLKGLGFSSKQIETLNEVICGTGTVEGAPHLKAEHLAVFDCANRCGKKGKRFISVEGHIRMMAAAQPFISGAISKTINLPNEASVEDIKKSYRLSWELALKANALYRDGCKLSQVLNSSADAKADEEADDEEGIESGKAEVAAEVATVASLAATAATEAPAPIERIVEKVVERIVERPLRRRLPDTRRSITHKFNVAGHEGYLTVGQYEDGSPGELFITMAKEGSTIGGVMDSLGTAISVALQYGVPIESLVNKFTHQRFEPAGMTHNPDIPFAKSLVDYIFRWMGIEFIPGYRAANVPVRGKKAEEPAAPTPSDELSNTVSSARARINTMIESRKSEEDSAPLRNGNGSNGGTGAGGSIVDPPRRIQTGVQINVETSESRQIRSDAAGVSTETVKFTNVSAVLSKAMKEMQADAPACDVCGTITVRSGTCYKCTNCGNSMGCS